MSAFPKNVYLSNKISDDHFLVIDLFSHR